MIAALLAGPPRVVNIGLAAFARDLPANGAAVVQVDWAPSAGGNAELLGALSQLDGRRIDAANRAVIEKILAAQPVLADVRRRES